MANASDLMGLGMGASLASLVGHTPINPVQATGLTSSGTTQVNAAPLLGDVGLVNPSTANATYTFWANSPVSQQHVFHNSSGSNTAVFFPPVGQSLNGTLNASQSLAPGKGMIIFRNGASDWRSILSA